jgi:hypothetical protein
MMAVNPFVNPNHRAIELPLGCKDLNDVLSRLGALRHEGLGHHKQGRLGEVRTYVRHFYEQASTEQILSILQWQKSVLLMVRRDEGTFELVLFLVQNSEAFVREAIAEIFGKDVNYRLPGVGVVQTAHAKLPEDWEESAQNIIDFLLRAYDISEEDMFIFSFQDTTVLPDVF